MDLELHALIDNNTWELVDLPADKTPIGCKWIFKVKYKADRTMEKYKARLLAKRFTQQEGLDYHETFSHVVKMVTIRSIVAITAQYDWTLFKKPYKLHLTQCRFEAKKAIFIEVPDKLILIIARNREEGGVNNTLNVPRDGVVDNIKVPFPIAEYGANLCGQIRNVPRPMED
ncbi:uncharacterized mitochondrial protein AtMg00820-like [Nicotiana tomentosiformis]|uniref:uncharacterized mitochondrial protein AtMg00820-like n=1 Tax=Nicotiana tomentosiformis TaxID=4098 RepID=UPI0008790C18|nr:uncharacterized mitochondrial protein AtMg00820-like [Nicotiana tomentosiformis]